MKILIVEDDLASREYLRNAIEMEGHDYRIAVNGSEALDIYVDFKPELILCDIQMPVMDGLELLETVRSRKSNSIFVMLTAFSTEEYAIRAFHLGANNYIKKPIRQNELLELLTKYERIIKNRRIGNPEIPGRLSKRELKLHFKSEDGSMPKVVDFLLSETADLFSNDEKISIELGLMELLTNAVEHGNLEITSPEKQLASQNGEFEELLQKKLQNKNLAEREVTVHFLMNEEYCEWIIMDQGNGFNWQEMQSNLQEDRLYELNGRGVFICQFLFDEMEFQGNGNTVRVRKNFFPSEVTIPE